MDTKIIFIYCLCDEFLKASRHRDDDQCKMYTSEIMTFAICSALFFHGNFSRTRSFFLSHRYFSSILSESRLNRRIHKIPPEIWLQIFLVCRYFLQDPNCQEFIVDSFPVPVCQTVRSWRCKLFPSKKYHGYCASKKLFYWGIKVHMIVSKEGIPIEFHFTPASEADVTALKNFEFDLPENSTLYGDKAYTHYEFEDLLKDVNIFLFPERKLNAKRKFPETIRYLQKKRRKRIETVFSQITHFMPRTIQAVTARGFALKVILFILAFSTSLCMH